ncbi:outer membrane protein assembly factor BamB [Allofranklinella schreckenbergeri]|uniref:Outer membrane protein assembly factor BamB n=1 Tax=Allofranklinella schreckenbergeri TaxID=1076744 RepID=A0A3M6Q9A8_9BURK|nr:outer membrane protein assembly factor BamB [Allofranklinella schreckenbergeri]RMW99041.1 outer membrane protein assembly factor BamB [Allofranklinella schreckenbergeri]
MMRIAKSCKALLLAVVASQLVACSLLSGNKAPKPQVLAPSASRVALSPAWTAQIGKLGDVQLRPQVNGNALTVATATGAVTSLDAETGAVLWQAKLGESLVAGVGGDGRVFAVVTAQNDVVALRDGQVIWRRALPGRSFTPPLVAGGRVFVLAADRALYAFDAEGGAPIWDRPGAEGEALALRQALLLTAVGDTLVTGFSGRVMGVNPDTGSLRWETPVAVPRGINDIERLVDVLAPFSRQGGGLCVQAFQTAIGCVDAVSGATLWTQRHNGAQGVGGDVDAIYGVDVSGRLQAWDRVDGKQKWLSDRLRHRQLSAPLSLGRAVAVGDSTGLLHLLDREDGSELTRWQVGKSALRAPLLVGQTLVVIAEDGSVQGLRLGEGALP